MLVSPRRPRAARPRYIDSTTESPCHTHINTKAPISLTASRRSPAATAAIPQAAPRPQRVTRAHHTCGATPRARCNPSWPKLARTAHLPRWDLPAWSAASPRGGHGSAASGAATRPPRAHGPAGPWALSACNHDEPLWQARVGRGEVSACVASVSAAAAGTAYRRHRVPPHLPARSRARGTFAARVPVPRLCAVSSCLCPQSLHRATRAPPRPVQPRLLERPTAARGRQPAARVTPAL
jgi:hypothetical protein